MKKFFTLISMLVISATIYAQIPNPSFENWSGGTPAGWYTQNDLYAGGVTQSSHAEAGDYAVQINVVDTSDGDVPVSGVLGAGSTSNEEFTDTVTPLYLDGWYIFNSVDTDGLGIESDINCEGGSNTGILYTYIYQSTSVYKEFSLAYNYGGYPCTAMTATITFFMNPKNISQGEIHPGTYAIIDNIRFAKVSGIDNVNKVSANLEPCTPNPATNTANIIYSIPAPASVTVALYDIAGRKIETLLNNIEQSPGRYKIPTDVSTLSSGIYFYTLTANGQTYTQKIAVTH